MIFTKIVGVTFVPKKNFVNLTTQELLYLVHESDNEYDTNAVAVFRKKNDLKLGYIKASHGLNEQFASQLDNGWRLMARVTDLTGDGWSIQQLKDGRLSGFCVKDDSLGFGVNIGVFAETKSI